MGALVHMEQQPEADFTVSEKRQCQFLNLEVQVGI